MDEFKECLRYKLPNLAFCQGFEAAARTLSLTKAAEELFPSPP